MFKDGEAKELFGVSELMRDLIRTWVPLPWAPHVEVATMQKLSTEHVSEGHGEAGTLTHRHGDVAWLVEVSRGPNWPAADSPVAAEAAASPAGDSANSAAKAEEVATNAEDLASETVNIGVEPLCSVLVMLEVQHQPMASMPLRMLEYVSMAMSRSFKDRGVVTPVLPVVLYTGVRPWGMQHSVRPLIHHPELVGDRFTPDMSYVLLELGSLPLPQPEQTEALNLATELVRVCSRANLAELASALERLMMVAEARGEERAADAMASRLALSLARRHRQRPMGRKVDTMKALIRQTDEWLYQPGFDDLEMMVEEERALRAELQLRLEQEQRMREQEQRMREQEQRKREQEQRKREQEQRKREQEQALLLAEERALREKEQRRVLRRLDPGLSREDLTALDAEEIERRLDALLAEGD